MHCLVFIGDKNLNADVYHSMYRVRHVTLLAKAQSVIFFSRSLRLIRYMEHWSLELCDSVSCVLTILLKHLIANIGSLAPRSLHLFDCENRIIKIQGYVC